jgi:hypothetical protein
VVTAGLLHRDYRQPRSEVSFVYTSFDDEIGEGEEIDVLPVVDSFA